MVKIIGINMKTIFFFLIYLFLFIIKFTPIKAETFEIEDISLNQKVTEFIKLSEVAIDFAYPDKKFASIVLTNRNYNLETYQKVQIQFEWNNENKLIKAIYGSLNIDNYENCLKKKGKVLNEIYTTFVDDIDDIKRTNNKKIELGIYNSDSLLLKNNDIIKIQCYDYKDDPLIKHGYPRFLFAIAIVSRDYEDWLSNESMKLIDKDKLNEFQIENFTVNDSLLNYISKDKIESYKKKNLIGNTNIYGIKIKENLDLYNEIGIYIKHNDSNYKIVALRGGKFFSNMNKCLKEKDELFNYLLNYLNNISDRALRLPFKDDVNSKGKKIKYITDYFIYNNNDEINITCEKKIGSNEIVFDVGFYTPELRGIK